MKFLCLHGNGTSSDVFETQTAALRHELGDEHLFEFVEAVHQVPMAEDLEIFATTDHNFFAYYNPGQLETLRKAIFQLSEYIDSEGPFDILLGFSAGAVLAAAYLLSQDIRANAKVDKSIRGAVFLASANSAYEFQYLGLKDHATSINVPTLHVWGETDKVAPDGGARLSDWCRTSLRRTLVHPGGHEIPKREYLRDTVHAMRRFMRDAGDT